MEVALQIAVGEYRWPGLTPEAEWRVVDVGANTAVFSLWAERLGADVITYEPERTVASLVANVAGATNLGEAGCPSGRSSTYSRSERAGFDETRGGGKEIESREALRDSVDVPIVTLADVVGSGCDLL